MNKLYQNFLRHIENAQERNALIDGFRIAMAVYDHGYPVEYSTAKDHLIENWVIGTCRNFFHEQEVQHKTQAEAFFSNCKRVNRIHFFHMLFRPLSIEDDKLCLDEFDNPLFDMTADSWPLYIALDSDGRILEKSDYEADIAKGADPKEYTIVRYIETEMEDGSTARIYADDAKLVEYTIITELFRSKDSRCGIDPKTMEQLYREMIDRCTEEDPVYNYKSFIQAQLDELQEIRKDARSAADDFIEFLCDTLSAITSSSDDENESSDEESNTESEDASDDGIDTEAE